MTGSNHLTHFPGVLGFFTSPAVVVSVLLALLGAYLWTEHREEALVALLWVTWSIPTAFGFRTRAIVG
jgi:4-amino-4-deoxy-L-arabinose transferase-like glycosyltransferase